MINISKMHHVNMSKHKSLYRLLHFLLKALSHFLSNKHLRICTPAMVELQATCPMHGAHKSFLCLTGISIEQWVGKHLKTSAFHWCWASPHSWQRPSHWSYCSLGAKRWHLCQVGQLRYAIKGQRAGEEMAKKEDFRELTVHSSAWPLHLLIYIPFFKNST